MFYQLSGAHARWKWMNELTIKCPIKYPTAGEKRQLVYSIEWSNCNESWIIEFAFVSKGISSETDFVRCCFYCCSLFYFLVSYSSLPVAVRAKNKLITESFMFACSDCIEVALKVCLWFKNAALHVFLIHNAVIFCYVDRDDIREFQIYLRAIVAQKS